MQKSLLAVALALFGAHSALADEWMVEAHYPDHAALVRAAKLFQHVIVDAQRQTLRVDTDEDGIAALEKAGLSVTIDTADTARLRGFYARIQDALKSGLAQRTADGYPSIPGYPCYRTVEGTYQTMDDLATAQPNLARVDLLGATWSGNYTMRALRVTNLATADADPDRPKMVVFSSIHAREYTPAELLTRMAEWLVAGYGTDPQATWLVDHVDFRFVLQANPDGRKKAETGISWRKNTDTANGACSGTPTGYSQPGIDLNRNFPFHWNSTGGEGSSGVKCDLTYRGPTAASEPETRNLVQYVAGTPGTNGVYSGGALPDRRTDDVSAPAPDNYAGLFMDIHSYSQLVLWPWGDTTAAAPNGTAMQTFGRRLAWFNDYTPEQSDSLYPTDGATDDNFYGTLGAPSFTTELGTSFFESCSSFTGSTYPQNLSALKYAARAAAAPYRLPAGPDVTMLSVSAPANGAGGLYATVLATIDDTRYNQSNGTQTTYAIRAANAYLDTPPWAPGAVPIPLSASDGTFNGQVEGVRGDIALTGVAPGRHLLYVQGVNTYGGGTGTPGTPDAVFVDVPQPSGTVTVTTSVSGEGTITPSAPQSVPVGTSLTYTIESATGHHVQSVNGCNGTWTPPSTYTTAPLTGDCTVTAYFMREEHTVGGSVVGLVGGGLGLTLNGLIPQSVGPGATRFGFSFPIMWGATYDVTINSQPDDPPQTCTIANGHGTVTGDVTDIVVTCTPDGADIIFADGFDH